MVCASCGIEPGRTVAYKPLLGRGHRAGVTHKPARCIVKQRPQLLATLSPGAT
jgi:propionyl-CoA synthetase